ncbi:TetR/AcrR family transcriptional regulator [Pseudoflavonifractor sp. DSM 107456]|uniref:TetR/AcrR family transcriptional regulator n=1 Tax=Pseudoflavonifractor gallinarum TaxID=2779352 RepID=A0ABR9RER2_9FIRM|nr:TetR/AcrR family transcriptional regulator [Pseudoflavonifractor gallinarum]MBE5057195.1 TetR/AcrR family transcriptional regulator [Pseudoflavonifractor gallinarum]MBS5134418.1 TetR/AcrR family transcriptional regulator [Oscillospiraceae bacterium]
MPRTLQEQRILDAALRVMAKYSISGTRMHLIAEEAGMAASNLHYHFKTKHDLLLALLAEIQDRFDQERSGLMLQETHSLRERLAVFFEQKKALILEQPRYDKVQFDFWLLGQSDETVKQDFRRSFDHWRGHLVESMLEFYPQMEAEYAKDLSYTLISLMMGASMQYLNGDGVSLDRYFSQCLDMVIGKIEADYGPSLIK